MHLDEIDRQLLGMLRADARQPISSLAHKLQVSRATVRSRIDRLVESGIIQGFTVMLKAGAETHAIRAITLVEVEGHVTEKVIRRLQGFPEVRTIHSTNGRWDIVAEIEVANLEEFDRTLGQIRHIEGITATETSILLSSRKTR